MLNKTDCLVLNGLLTALAAYCRADKQKIIDLLAEYLFDPLEVKQLKEVKDE